MKVQLTALVAAAVVVVVAGPPNQQGSSAAPHRRQVTPPGSGRGSLSAGGRLGWGPSEKRRPAPGWLTVVPLCKKSESKDWQRLFVLFFCFFSPMLCISPIKSHLPVNKCLTTSSRNRLKWNCIDIITVLFYIFIQQLIVMSVKVTKGVCLTWAFP